MSRGITDNDIERWTVHFARGKFLLVGAGEQVFLMSFGCVPLCTEDGEFTAWADPDTCRN